MTIPYQGHIEDATGDLVSAGHSVAKVKAGHTVRTDVPFPGKVRGVEGNANMHRWNGSAWVEVTNIARPKKTPEFQDVVLRSPDGSRWLMQIDNNGTVTYTKQ